MADTIPSTCPRCASPMSSADAAGLCPRCLLAMNFQTRTMPTGGDAASSPPPSPAELAEKFPQFEILECLGRGGMGIVYKARQKALDRIVAIKILAGEWQDAPGFAERFEKEAKLLAKLNHPNIVTIHDFGNAGGLFHIVMEFIDGVNVRDLLREGKMPAEQALAIVPPICGALQFAHDHGIVHRDIKPENILLDREGRVKIADFGIATLAGDAADRSGTPAYMAPEQGGRAGRIDHRADIYALGVVLYEMLTGERPTASPVAPSKRVMIDVRLDEVVLRALENAPELRFQTAADFRTGVETVVRANPPVPAGEWQLRCTTCHSARSLASAGGIRIGAASVGKRTLAWCRSCGGLRFAAIEKAGGHPATPPLSPPVPPDPRQSAIGLLLHFAPALLLAVAWLTSGLEKGAVLILGVVIVAGLVIRALGPKKLARKVAVPLLVMATLAGVVLWVTMKRDRFGPVVDRVIPPSAPGKPCALDFETGDLRELLPGMPAGDVVFEKGVLVFLNGHAEMPPPDEGPDPVVRGFSSWRLDEVLEPVPDVRRMTLVRDPSGRPIIAPLSTPFRTGEGNRGVLEVGPVFDAISGKPVGLRVRYKLLRTTAQRDR